MCLIILALKQHPVYDLILMSNRDEFYERPTKVAGFWDDFPDLLAGKDSQGGGTWLGITKTGRIAALTNYRNPALIKAGSPTRGRLVSDFLKGEDTIEGYIEKIDNEAGLYNGFSLILGVGKRLVYYSNINRQSMELSPGIHGLSNHLINTPWPKVDRGKSQLERLIKNEGKFSEAEAFNILYDRYKPDDSILPDTGVGIERERMLSPIFIRSPDYGTRSSTLILIDRNGHVMFIEKSHTPGTNKTGVLRFDFQICSG